jgi:hypothetical protein
MNMNRGIVYIEWTPTGILSLVKVDIFKVNIGTEGDR